MTPIHVLNSLETKKVLKFYWFSVTNAKMHEKAVTLSNLDWTQTDKGKSLNSANIRFSTEIIATDKEEEAFKDLDAAILVGSMPRREGMERKDLLKANVAIFKSQGAALEKYAKKTVKVETASGEETSTDLWIHIPFQLISV